LTLLATDKTGTLTRNQMTVSNLWNGTKMYTAFQSNNDEENTSAFSRTEPGMEDLLAIAVLNSRIKFDKIDVPFAQREILGDATETGLSRFAGRSLEDYDAYVAKYPKVFEVPFNSTNKWALVIVRVLSMSHVEQNSWYTMAQVNKTNQNSNLTSYIKGAPERVLQKCSSYMNGDGNVVSIDDAFRVAYEDAYNVSDMHLIFAL
jgi:sodium/potassium-transporting ATPase subunit alpha